MVSGHTTSGGLVRGAPKTHRAKVALKKVLPKLIENPKSALFLKGERCSGVVQSVMTDFYMLKKPYAVKMTKKNEFRPFDDAKHLEFLAFKNDCSLFCFGSHVGGAKKKRPHNLIIGRHFDYQLLDMLELGITKYEGIKSDAHIVTGSKPMLMFHGELFSTNPTLQRVQNLLADFFRGKIVEQVQLLGLDHVIDITVKPTNPSKDITIADNGQSIENCTLMFRHFCVSLKRSGEKVPKVELTNVGPTIDFEVRRVAFAAPAMFKMACKLPKGVVPRKEKNITTDAMGDKIGQIHLEPQTKSLATMGTRKFKAHKKGKKSAEGAEPREAEVSTDNAAAKKRKRAGMGLIEGGEEVGPSIMPKAKRAKKKAA
eukprot:TRINITY_DN33583_c0_g1_i1.p1 TRINITY_DN33583_c0_g1~~TRINITY_DN33583_c0_g1_i1.p1  ORF type:complete len:381 (+),score=106.34 TRINITY_DN33583_c0_g1_i1:36-1145(+)